MDGIDGYRNSNPVAEAVLLLARIMNEINDKLNVLLMPQHKIHPMLTNEQLQCIVDALRK